MLRCLHLTWLLLVDCVLRGQCRPPQSATAVEIDLVNNCLKLFTDYTEKADDLLGLPSPAWSSEAG